MNIGKKFVEAFQKKRTTSAYDTVAEVVRVEGSTAWVHIPGGVDETPVQVSIDVKAGDKINMRVSGGRAWVSGNSSAPPTDDTTANVASTKATVAQKTANTARAEASEAEKVAINYLAQDSTGIMVADLNDGEETPSTATGRNVLIDSDSVEIRNGQDSLASFGEIVTIGQKNDTAKMVLTKSSMQFFDDAGESKGLFRFSSGSGTEGISVTLTTGTSTSHTVTLDSPVAGCTLYFSGNAYIHSRYCKIDGYGTYTDGWFEIGNNNITSIVVDVDTTAGTLVFSADGYRLQLVNVTIFYEATVSLAPSYTLGAGTIASSTEQTAIGKYNEEDESDTYAFIIGNGSSGSPSNALTVDWDGNIAKHGGFIEVGLSANTAVSVSTAWTRVVVPIDTVNVQYGDTSLFTLESSGKITVNETGYYRLSAYVANNAPSSSASVYFYVYAGSDSSLWGIRPAQAGYNGIGLGSTVRYIEAGSTVDLRITSGTTGSYTVAGGPSLRIEKIDSYI